MPDGRQFEAGTPYRIDFKYTATILAGKTGVYCAIDPDILSKYQDIFAPLKFKSLDQLHLIEDTELRATILDNSIFCTNLEPAEARTFLPCLDEPSFKAKFKLAVNRSEAQSNHTAISNTPIVSNRVADTFDGQNGGAVI